MGNHHIEKLKLSIPILISKPKISDWLAMTENHSQCFEKMNNLITIDYSIMPFSNTGEDQLINSVNFTASKKSSKTNIYPTLVKEYFESISKVLGSQIYGDFILVNSDDSTDLLKYYITTSGNVLISKAIVTFPTPYSTR